MTLSTDFSSICENQYLRYKIQYSCDPGNGYSRINTQTVEHSWGSNVVVLSTTTASVLWVHWTNSVLLGAVLFFKLLFKLFLHMLVFLPGNAHKCTHKKEMFPPQPFPTASNEVRP